MRLIVVLPLISFTALPRLAGAQAPPSANMWRVAATSLAVPPALEGGPTATFWNPASMLDTPGVATGLQVARTSDILGLSGILGGLTVRAGGKVHLALILGRMEVRDLIRTTTSPNSVAGSIPVYEQFAGLGVGFRAGVLHLGSLLYVHDARFDAVREGGATLDVGIRVRPVPRLTVGVATHLLPIDLGKEESTDYFGGIEYLVFREIPVAGASAGVVARYGATLHHSGDLDHMFGTGLSIAQHVRVDVALTSEAAFGQRAWRPVLGLSLRIGRYSVAVARSSGLNDVGATYRIGLDVQITQ